MCDLDTPFNRIRLKELYEEIDYYDRLIEHCQTGQRFESEHERAQEMSRLNRRRDRLVREADKLGRSGVKPPDRFEPRSFKAGKHLSTSDE